MEQVSAHVKYMTRGKILLHRVHRVCLQTIEFHFNLGSFFLFLEECVYNSVFTPLKPQPQRELAPEFEAKANFNVRAD